MIQEEVIAVVKDCTSKLGHAPTVVEFHQMSAVTKRQVRKLFGSHTRMLAASGVSREGSGYPISMRSLFLDWAGIVRSLGAVPTLIDYERTSRYSIRPLNDRFGGWRNVAAGMLKVAREEGLEEEWRDVLDIVVLHLRAAARSPETSGPTFIPSCSSAFRAGQRDGQPVYGQPLPHSPFSHAPTNEAGVLVLFGAMARELGLVIHRVQSEFPDCEAMRRVGPNRWQRVRIEFEYESHSFLTHMHPAEECDLIVCWTHNWPDCPLEVLALEGLVKGQSEIAEIAKIG
jgi:Homing endonuclease associated repeat